jgi:hypothetical protein
MAKLVLAASSAAQYDLDAAEVPELEVSNAKIEKAR